MAEPYLEILTNTIANLKLNTSPETLLECKITFGGGVLRQWKDMHLPFTGRIWIDASGRGQDSMDRAR